MASELDPERIRALFHFDERWGTVRFMGDRLPDLRLPRIQGYRWDITMNPQGVDVMPYGANVTDALLRKQAAVNERDMVKGRVIHITWHPTNRRPARLLASIAFHIPQDNDKELVITAIGTSPDDDVAQEATFATWVLKQYLHALAPLTSHSGQPSPRADTVVRGVPKTAISEGVVASMDLLGFAQAQRVPGIKATSLGFRQPAGVSGPSPRRDRH